MPPTTMNPPAIMRTALRAWKPGSSGPRCTPRRDVSILAGDQTPCRRSLPRRKTITSYRNITTYSTPTEKFRTAVLNARKENPVLLPVLFVAALGALSLMTLMAYDEYTRVAPHYSAYPTAVEQRLRLALHYTHVQPDPDRATVYFTDAIKAVEGTGMDPYGKEAMGVRIRFAEMLESFGRVKAAIEVLNTITADCEEKLERTPRDVPLTTDRNRFSEPDQNSNQTLNFRKALIKAVIQSKVKVASLYETDYMQDPNMARTTLSEAIGLLTKEAVDPQVNAFSEENAAGLTMEEISSLLSQMGDLFATTGEESNAVQTYLLALEPLRKACHGSRSCKEVQIFSNIAASMHLAMKKPGAQINGKPATKELMAAGRKAAVAWADQAIGTAGKVDQDSRDQICDTAVLSAQLTRADLLLEGGDKNIAKQAFEELIPSLRQKGLNSLSQIAEQGLRQASS